MHCDPITQTLVGGLGHMCPRFSCSVNANASWCVPYKDVTGTYLINAGCGGCFGYSAPTLKRNGVICPAGTVGIARTCIFVMKHFGFRSWPFRWTPREMHDRHRCERQCVSAARVKARCNGGLWWLQSQSLNKLMPCSIAAYCWKKESLVSLGSKSAPSPYWNHTSSDVSSMSVSEVKATFMIPSSVSS